MAVSVRWWSVDDRRDRLGAAEAANIACEVAREVFDEES